MLFEPTLVGVDRGLEVGLVAVAADAERRVEVSVAKRLRSGVDACDAAQFGGKGVVAGRTGTLIPKFRPPY